MAGVFIPPRYYLEAQRFNSAAKDCDELADKLTEQAGKVGKLQDQVRSAWKGDAGVSLDNALVDKSSSLYYAAGILRGAAGDLRAAAARVAQKKD